MLKKKKGFISVSVIYSFFIVFILLMIAMLMSFTNKKYLKRKLDEQIKNPSKDIAQPCTKGDKLSDCLFKAEYAEFSVSDENSDFYKKNQFMKTIRSGDLAVNVKEKIAKNKVLGTSNELYKQDLKNVVTTEQGLFKAEDDFGNTYYYRGAEDDNYLSFAGYTWRIVRITGQGAIRIILEESIPLSTESKVYTTGFLESDDKDSIAPRRHGYMIAAMQSEADLRCASYSCAGINKYRNNYDSNPKATIEQFYEKNIKGEFRDFVNKESIFVGDKNTMTDKEEGDFGESWNYEGSGFFGRIKANYKNAVLHYRQTYYASANRLFMNQKYYDDTGYSPSPTLRCESSASGAIFKDNKIFNLSCYSYYSIIPNSNDPGSPIIGNNEYIITDESVFENSKSKGNGELKYPVAAISADEIALAGGVVGKENKKFYLYNRQANCTEKPCNASWTMTLAITDRNGWNNFSVQEAFKEFTVPPLDSKRDAYYFTLEDDGSLKIAYGGANRWVRPVLDLKKDIIYCSGRGTKEDPYKLGMMEGEKIVCQN